MKLYSQNLGKWKSKTRFDVWYLKQDERYTHLVMDCIKSFKKELELHSKKRETILKIKEAYFNGVKYKDKVKSIDIYKAVLGNNIDSVVAFTKFIKK
ncbi:MAG: hypothetical protein UT34_C0002G0327 [candidate division WS6 bacterium GW2011_GWF2_39_15]|uniref:Uncharacterized protein n=1 Tax=candidate division WS6 bacterium GW2011_GWF2_39_15 TaxID=1619100 RepID=A0A0G0Q5X9_9BACT|nr:MAG: hypothetical protein UT34_C0002G0327 [candidate division WS6 bacterium GW2011_GWF2_39_15]